MQVLYVNVNIINKNIDSSKGNQMNQESNKRSIMKAISYRIIIILLDFSVIYLLTKKISVAAGFMIISNIYTTVAYFFHERIWNKIKWGINPSQ